MTCNQSVCNSSSFEIDDLILRFNRSVKFNLGSARTTSNWDVVWWIYSRIRPEVSAVSYVISRQDPASPACSTHWILFRVKSFYRNTLARKNQYFVTIWNCRTRTYRRPIRSSGSFLSCIIFSCASIGMGERGMNTEFLWGNHFRSIHSEDRGDSKITSTFVVIVSLVHSVND
jgi:hypothetical protein